MNADTKEQLERIESQAENLAAHAKIALQENRMSQTSFDMVEKRISILYDAWRKLRSSL